MDPSKAFNGRVNELDFFCAGSGACWIGIRVKGSSACAGGACKAGMIVDNATSTSSSLLFACYRNMCAEARFKCRAPLTSFLSSIPPKQARHECARPSPSPTLLYHEFCLRTALCVFPGLFSTHAFCSRQEQSSLGFWRGRPIDVI